MSATSRIAPSITTPAIFRWRQLSDASSPQTAGPTPPASITITSPARADSIASTGLAQSPGYVRTVTAGPARRAPGTTGSRPGRSPDRCIASEMFGVETFPKISRSRSSPPRLNSSVAAGRRSAIARKIVRAASSASGDFVIAPPTMMMSPPASTASGAVSEFSPPATPTGRRVALRTRRRTSNGSRPRICSSIGVCTSTCATPHASHRAASPSGSGACTRSTTTSIPQLRPASTHSRIVASAATPRTVAAVAPALAAASISVRPASMILRSATIGCRGNSRRRARTMSSPALLIRGVPASMTCAPPRTASRAQASARDASRKSRAICRTGSVMDGLWEEAGGEDKEKQRAVSIRLPVEHRQNPQPCRDDRVGGGELRGGVETELVLHPG